MNTSNFDVNTGNELSSSLVRSLSIRSCTSGRSQRGGEDIGKDVDRL